MPTTRETLVNYLKFFATTDYRMMNKFDKTSLTKYVNIVLDVLEEELLKGNAIKIKNYGTIGVFKNRFKPVRNPKKPNEVAEQKKLLIVRVMFNSFSRYIPAYENVTLYSSFCEKVFIKFNEYMCEHPHKGRLYIDDIRLLTEEFFTRIKTDRNVQIRDFACFRKTGVMKRIVDPANGIVTATKIVYARSQAFSKKLIDRVQASEAYATYMFDQRVTFGLAQALKRP